MTREEAVKAVLREVLEAAAEAGKAERERLGRDLTEAEAERLAAMVRRQFELAVATLR